MWTIIHLYSLLSGPTVASPSQNGGLFKPGSFGIEHYGGLKRFWITIPKKKFWISILWQEREQYIIYNYFSSSMISSVMFFYVQYYVNRISYRYTFMEL